MVHILSKGGLSLGAGVSGIATVTAAEPVAQTFARLGLPVALMGWLGALKLAGAATLWVSNPILREWVYSGFAFAMTGATYLHLAAGDSIAETGGPIALLALLAGTVGLDERRRWGVQSDH